MIHNCGGTIRQTPIVVKVAGKKETLVVDGTVCEQCGELGMKCGGKGNCMEPSCKFYSSQ